MSQNNDSSVISHDFCGRGLGSGLAEQPWLTVSNVVQSDGGCCGISSLQGSRGTGQAPLCTWDLSSWLVCAPSRHSSLRLLTWWRFRAPKASVLREREPGRNCIPFNDLALEDICHFCHILFTETVIKSQSSSRGGDGLYLLMGELKSSQESLWGQECCPFLENTIFYSLFYGYNNPHPNHKQNALIPSCKTPKCCAWRRQALA